MGLMVNGGWVMLILFGLSITAGAIVFQKILMLRATALNQQFIQTVKAKLKTQGVDVVMNELRYSSQVEDQIAAKTIEVLGASQDTLAAEICELTRQDVESLTGKMNVLSMIITAAPVLGLLGTVLGLMDVFSVIAIDGVGKAELLSAGISKALVTTVAGLSLAIPLMFIHQMIHEKINKRLDEWNNIPVQLSAYVKGLPNA